MSDKREVGTQLDQVPTLDLRRESRILSERISSVQHELFSRIAHVLKVVGGLGLDESFEAASLDPLVDIWGVAHNDQAVQIRISAQDACKGPRPSLVTGWNECVTAFEADDRFSEVNGGNTLIAEEEDGSEDDTPWLYFVVDRTVFEALSHPQG